MRWSVWIVLKWFVRRLVSTLLSWSLLPNRWTNGQTDFLLYTRPVLWKGWGKKLPLIKSLFLCFILCTCIHVLYIYHTHIFHCIQIIARTTWAWTLWDLEHGGENCCTFGPGDFLRFYNSKFAPAKTAPKSAHIHRGHEQGDRLLSKKTLPHSTMLLQLQLESEKIISKWLDFTHFLTTYYFYCRSSSIPTGCLQKKVLLRFLSYFCSRSRILLFHMCFGIRISSPFHLTTQIMSIQNLNCP